MIWESKHWKEPLLKMANRLQKFKSTDKLAENQFVQIEKDIFIGFYSVRKLLETVVKVTDTIRDKKVPVVWYPNKKHVTIQNSYKIEELYDLEITHNETRDLCFICGRIIHSFILVPIINDNGGLAGIMFTSDRDKNKRIYSLDVESIIEIFQGVGKDYPTYIVWSKDPISGDIKTKVK